MTETNLHIHEDHNHDDHAHHDHAHQGHAHHEHDHGHSHDHSGGGIIGLIGAALHLPGFGHDHEHDHGTVAADVIDNNLGIRTVWLALAALGITTVIQVIIYLASGSVALLADTVHNLGDALNSIPLLMALYLARRAATRRYTYGFGRAEDVAGILIVVSIAFSAAYILWESVQKLINPQPLTNLGWVAAAALVGFVGNELVAMMQIRVGRHIGSDAMIADGQHARVDGLTSLAVLIAVGGTLIGLPILDPIIGIVIAIAIVGITWNAIKAVWFRLMDAIDPKLMDRIEHQIYHVEGVQKIQALRAHWVGHRLNIEVTASVKGSLSVAETDHISEHIREEVLKAVPQLGEMVVQFQPA